MRIEETRVKNFSIQFESKDEALEYLDALINIKNNAYVSDLGSKLNHRLSDKYAHDDIKYTTVVYNTEVKILIDAYLRDAFTKATSKHDDVTPKNNKSSFLQKLFH